MFPSSIAYVILSFRFDAIPEAFYSLSGFTSIDNAAIGLTTRAVRISTIFRYRVSTRIVVLITHSATLTEARASDFGQFRTTRPYRCVSIIRVLFRSVISKWPFPICPILSRMFTVIPIFLAFTRPRRTLVPMGCAAHGFASDAFRSLLMEFSVITLIVALYAYCSA